MVTRIVFANSILICQLLVKLEALSHTIQTPGISANTQPIRITSSWAVSRPQNILFPGLSSFGNTRPLHERQRRLVAATESADSSGNTDPNSTRRNRFIDNLKSIDSVKASAEDEMMTSIWELKHGAPVLSQIDDYKKLASHSCYLIWQTPVATSREELAHGRIYYWAGNRSSDEEAASAAAIAMLNKLVYQDFSTVELRRETEGQESHAFKALFKGHKAESSSNEKVSKQIDIAKKRIFVIEGKNNVDGVPGEVLDLNEVELSLAEVLNDERSCYVFVSKKVYVSCGINAPVIYKLGAGELAKIMMKKKGLMGEEVKMYRTDLLFSSKVAEETDWFQFFKEFEHLPRRVVKQHLGEKSEEFSPREIRNILNQTAMKPNGTEWFNIKVTRIFQTAPDENVFHEERIFPSNSVPLILDYHTKDCLLIDSRSNAGLFIWMGKNTTFELDMECAYKAELYLREKEYNYANRITFVHQKDLSIEVDSAQALIEYLVARNDDEDQNMSAASEESSLQCDDSICTLDDSEDNDRGNLSLQSADVNLKKKKQPNFTQKRIDAVNRNKQLLQMAIDPATDQKDTLTLDQLAELLIYCNLPTGEQICKVMGIGLSEIEVILSQIDFIKSHIRSNCSVRKRLIKLFNKLKQYQQSPIIGDSSLPEKEKSLSKNRRNSERKHREAVDRNKVLLQTAESEIINRCKDQKGALTLDQLAELMEYDKLLYTGEDICKVMNIQPSKIDAILGQIEAIKSYIRGSNSGDQSHLNTLFHKLKQFQLQATSKDHNQAED